jgi:O-antigen ligase
MIAHQNESGGVWNRAEPQTFPAGRALLVLSLFLAPLPFGAVYTWAWVTLTILSLGVLSLWMFGSLQRGKLKLRFSPLFVPVAFFLAFGLAQFLLHWTLAPIATRDALLQFATCSVIFFVTVQLFGSASSDVWRNLGFALLLFGFVFSFLSILQFFWIPSRIIWVDHDLGIPFGPYVDPDHYAGLMEMVVPLSAAYALSRPKGEPLNGILWFAVLVPAASLLLTGSRGGFISLLVEIAIMAWLLVRRIPLPSGRTRAAFAAVGLMAMAALFFWLVPARVLNKLETVNNYVPATTTGSRPAMWRDSLRIFRDHPWVGAGLGSFVTVYPLYQTSPLDLVAEHAHNDYVEALAEGGLCGGAIVAVALALFIAVTFKNFAPKAGHESSWIRLGAVIACYGLLVHTFVDFNLHIPANADWFAFCAGVACLQGRSFKNDKSPIRRGQRVQSDPALRRDGSSEI